MGNGNSRSVDQRLVEAAKRGNVQRVQEILANGANVNAKDEDGTRTAFQWACLNDHLEVAKLLVRHGSNGVFSQDSSGRTELHLACCRGQFEMAQFLVQNGANINAKDHEGRTPLYRACYKGCVEIARFLVEHGADVNAEDFHIGQTPLHLACEYGIFRISEWLAEDGNGNRRNLDPEEPPIGHSQEYGNLELAQLLVENGAKVNAKDCHGMTPLFFGCWRKQGKPLEPDDLSVAKCLIDNGAAVNIKDAVGWTPLCYACQGGHIQVVQLLVSRGATVLAAETTPLEIACKENQTEVVWFLVRQCPSLIDKTPSEKFSQILRLVVTEKLKVLLLVVVAAMLAIPSFRMFAQRLYEEALTNAGQEL